jgi:hypothetical protein
MTTKWTTFNEVIKIGFVGFYSNGSFYNRDSFRNEPFSLIAVNHPINSIQCKQLLSCLPPQVFDPQDAEKFLELKVGYTLQNKIFFQKTEDGESPYLVLHARVNDFSKYEDKKHVDVTVFDLTKSALLYHADQWCCWIHKKNKTENIGCISPPPSHVLNVTPDNISQEILYIIKDGSSLTIGVCHLVPDAVFKEIQEYLEYQKHMNRPWDEICGKPKPQVSLEHVLKNPHFQRSFLESISHTLYPPPSQVAPIPRKHRLVAHRVPVKEVDLVAEKRAARAGLRRSSLLGQSEERARLIINDTSEAHSNEDAPLCDCCCTIL